MSFDSELALKNYEARKAKNALKPKVINSILPAGSPMYYYCVYCGDPTEVLPEDHLCPPKTVCDACKTLRDHGCVFR